uniref:Large ribosomal subunit protein uL11m n=1 Tax=Tetraselmis sp. GSL018 TaxID=582737 RepID=A0A061R0U4_9CHLO|mmetsp:Transcript_24025/g.57252  ORF Transcript_24025/g.57252 Transcript_24025/m.57252 type:complete len:172 (+) Transcript_24025:89-604(+)
MATKTITNTIRLLIPAGAARPAPPVGPALGQAGLNIMSFCKDFNAKTQNIKADVPIPVVISAYSDKSFEYVMKKPPVTYLVKKAAGLDTCSSAPGFQVAGVISLKHIYEIAKVKKEDDVNTHLSMQAVCKSIIATCKSMGIRVVPRPEDAKRALAGAMARGGREGGARTRP